MLWLTVSKAFCRSKNTLHVNCPESQACFIFIFFVSSVSACIVERLFLKPNCFSYRTFCAVRKFETRLWTSVSIILLRFDSKEIGRLLVQREGSSILKKGVTFPNFCINGKIPVEKERFIIKDIDLLSSFWNNFKNLVGILNGPEALFLFKSLILFRTSCSFVGVKKKICRQGFFK